MQRSSTPEPPARVTGRAGRHTRLWLLLLLVATALFSAGALTVQYKLGALRPYILDAVEDQTGFPLRSPSAIAINGFHSIRLDNFGLTTETSQGVVMDVTIPSATVAVDMLDLLSGQTTIEEVLLDGAVVRIERPGGSPAPELRLPKAGAGRGGLPPLPSFRIVGRDCRLEFVEKDLDRGMTLSSLEFDVSRLARARRLEAEVAGVFESAGRRVPFAVDVQYADASDFSLHAHCDSLTADTVNAFLPAAQRVVQSGQLRPRLRVDAYPDRTAVLWLESPFSGVTVRNQPDFVTPQNGTATFLAQYDLEQKALTVKTADLQTDQGEASLQGTIGLAGDSPALDLRVTTERLPLQVLVEYFLAGRTEQYGTLAVTAGGPFSAGARILGTVKEPQIVAEAALAKGAVAFSSDNTAMPSVQLDLANLTATWNSDTRQPEVSCNIAGGNVKHAKLGATADSLAGVLRLKDGILSVAPVSGRVAGRTVVLEAAYNLAERTGEARCTGTLAEIEKTPLSTRIRNVELAGAAGVSATAKLAPNKYVIDGVVDATQLDVKHVWWLHKTPGLGATATAHLEVVPQKTFLLEADVQAAGSKFSTTLKMAKRGPKWRLLTSDLLSDHIEVADAGKWLRIPYTVTGGVATDAEYHWERRSDADADDWQATTKARVDEISVVAHGKDVPLRCKDLQLSGVITKGASPTGKLTLSAGYADVPSLGTEWMVPMRSDEELLKRFPPVPREWEYTLSAESMRMPPWEGKGFYAEAYSGPAKNGFRHYSATVGGGHIEGTYAQDRLANAYQASNAWQGIPASSLIAHLKLPSVLDGSAFGEIVYSQDRDDPDTRQGEGRFEIREGQFSADFLLSQFEQQFQGEMIGLPVLRFSELETELSFQNDLVRTPLLRLASQGIKLDATGQFVREGDMSYDVSVSIAPETAERIEALRNAFNTQGYRLAGENIELRFTLSGPTFKPRSEVAELPPVRVTLVSGVLGVTGEAVKVLDLPRKILVDLLKIGGGIMGATK